MDVNNWCKVHHVTLHDERSQCCPSFSISKRGLKIRSNEEVNFRLMKKKKGKGKSK